jgi:uncharacterized protein with PIN domain
MIIGTSARVAVLDQEPEAERIVLSWLPHQSGSCRLRICLRWES